MQCHVFVVEAVSVETGEPAFFWCANNEPAEADGLALSWACKRQYSSYDAAGVAGCDYMQKIIENENPDDPEVIHRREIVPLIDPN